MANVMIDERRLRDASKRLAAQGLRYRRLWAYFKNPMRVTATANTGSERPYRQAQEWGLPPRITGFASGSEPLADAIDRTVARKEVVIENDIVWRIDTMVDYLFGKPLVIASAAPDPSRRETIGRFSSSAARSRFCPVSAWKPWSGSWTRWAP